ncbi:hypothetical protein BB561_003645 [Smittium simulii]|uniref:FHA domain-containing protein n=1 Tax=Smittium simulii TaxID=133385 RepID=A0A2T9YK67_9FUNG|nr:hypothetical protein BB561_003645 [Smittium simulii]
MASTEDYYEFTQPTQPIDESTQNIDEEEPASLTQNKVVATLVKLNGHLIQNYNLYTNLPILIGRHRTCEIVIDSNFSSNKHCKIYAVESTGLQDLIVFCEDLSSNGTLWNGKKIGRGNKVILSHGDTLEIKKGNYITFLLKNRILRKHDNENQLDVSNIYQITDKVLGSGTFAKVKLAIRKDTNEQVAVKIMDKVSLKNPGSIGGGTNYIDEINLLRAFDHPNIVRVFEVQETEKQVFIFMPL